ncbi:MAG: DUF1326 domain-containing protein [Pirellulales bacterium]|nr:DUF1326 domain-containing protein [Pirellulales bacterium]
MRHMHSRKHLAWATALVVALVFGTDAAHADGLVGDYLETRTCDVFTGPCFANSQVGLTGHEALLAWSIDSGEYRGTDLTNLKVVLVVRASDTLGFGGGLVLNPYPIRSVVVVDERATSEQREALVEFVRARAGSVAGETVRVEAAPIAMTVDHDAAVAKLVAGKLVSLTTRKLEAGDCTCSHEDAFYPPLSSVDNAQPAFALTAAFRGRGLGVKWETTATRSVFLGTFQE